MSNILVNGIVASRDKQPYLQIDIDGRMVQLTMAAARSVARDIEVACARAEADAMIHKFFSDQQYPQGANDAIMLAFRDFRMKLDEEAVERKFTKPSEDE